MLVQIFQFPLIKICFPNQGSMLTKFDLKKKKESAFPKQLLEINFIYKFGTV